MTPRSMEDLRVYLLSDPPGVTDYPGSRRAVVSLHVGASVEVGCQRDGRYHRGLGVHGDIDIIPPGTASRWELKERDSSLILAVSQTLLSRAAEESGGDPEKIQVANRFQIRDPQMEQIGWALKAEVEAGYPGGRVYFDSLGLALATSLLARHGSGGGEVSRYKYGMSGRRLRTVLDYIEDNLSRDLSLKEIADVAGLSVSHCKTAFSKSVGAPIHQYVIQRRVERAKQLLSREGMSVSQVAAETGFTHKSHLAFHTRRVYGLSPTGLRRRGSGL
jgi:AraC family transcriptional regulator